MCYGDNYFPKRKFQLYFISLYHSVYWECTVFKKFVFYCQLFAVRYLWKRYVMKHRDQ